MHNKFKVGDYFTKGFEEDFNICKVVDIYKRDDHSSCGWSGTEVILYEVIMLSGEFTTDNWSFCDYPGFTNDCPTYRKSKKIKNPKVYLLLYG